MAAIRAKSDPQTASTVASNTSAAASNTSAAASNTSSAASIPVLTALDATAPVITDNYPASGPVITATSIRIVTAPVVADNDAASGPVITATSIRVVTAPVVAYNDAATANNAATLCSEAYRVAYFDASMIADVTDLARLATARSLCDRQFHAEKIRGNSCMHAFMDSVKNRPVDNPWRHFGHRHGS